MTVPAISILIVNYNTRNFLEKCLKSIFNTGDDLSVEVFVIDNNSSDGSAEMVEAMFPEACSIRLSQNDGFAKAVNKVLPFAKGKFCLLLHPDMELLPETLKHFIDFFEAHPEAGILGGNLYYPDGTPNPCEIMFPGFKNDVLCLSLRLLKRLPGGRWLAGGRNPFEWSHKSTSCVNWVWNACMMVRREVFESVGYFDDNFFVWYADWDFCKRAADAGWLIFYVHPATAIHHERQSFPETNIPREEIRYKVDGWCSAIRQASDRQVFLKKHCNLPSIYGVKTVAVLENLLRVWFIMGRLVIRNADSRKLFFQLKTCLRTIQAILGS